MKENIYDNQEFFEKYSQMARSQKGLEGAGEWHQLKPLLPDFKDKTVLDLGCGYGWHCIYAAQQGAQSVIGVDLSESMLNVAKKKSAAYPQVTYIHSGIEEADFPENSFDVIISSLALHYVPTFSKVAEHAAKFLKPNGQFIFSVEHPVFTAEGKQDWIYDEAGNILYFPVDDYFYEGQRTAEFLGERVTKYHKTLTTYIDGLLTNGFQLQRLVEPTPSEPMLDIPGMKDEMRRPMMLIISAVNKKAH